MSISHYRAVVTTVGPVFIGSGNEIKKFEYVYDRKTGTVYIIDTLKLFELLMKKNDLERFEQHIAQNRSLTDYFERIGLMPQQYGLIAKYSYKAGEDPRNQNIKEFVKDAYGQPYIPGSSLKGAVRTAIMHGIIQDYSDRGKYPRERDDVYKIMLAGDRSMISDIGKCASDFEKKKLHTLSLDEKHPKSAVNSIMRGLRISDSEPIPLGRLCLCKKLDVSLSDERSLNLLRECLMPETQIVFDLDIDNDYFPYDTDFIEKSFDVQYKVAYAQQQKFTMHPPVTRRNGEHLITLGGGSGYLSKTFTHRLMSSKDNMDIKMVSAILDKQFYKHNHRKDVDKGVSPHIRKMTVVGRKYYDMGICRIEITER